MANNSYLRFGLAYSSDQRIHRYSLFYFSSERAIKMIDELSRAAPVLTTQTKNEIYNAMRAFITTPVRTEKEFVCLNEIDYFTILQCDAKTRL